MSTNKLPQVDMILAHMATHGGITVQDATLKLGCQRLAARIKDLRDWGWDIKTETVGCLGGLATTRYTPANSGVRARMRTEAKDMGALA